MKTKINKKIGVTGVCSNCDGGGGGRREGERRGEESETRGKKV